MSTTDLAIATALFGPGIAAGIAYARSLRGWREDSDAIQTVLALSAAERAAALLDDADAPAPPDGGQPTPNPVAEIGPRLAAVIGLDTRRAA